MIELGKMKDARIDCFIESARELLRADDVKRALFLLDNLPGWFRANPPKEVIDLKNEVQKRMATSNFYAFADDVEISPHLTNEAEMTMEHSLRGSLIIKDVSTINEHGHTPHIVDFGPGTYWLPMILTAKGLKFTYESKCLNHIARDFHKKRWDIADKKENHQEPRPMIFVAGEVIEHLHEPAELRHQMLRSCGFADICHISTPYLSFDTECTNWIDKNDLGHFTTFTAEEFRILVSSLFGEYSGAYYISQIQHARLVFINSSFDFIRDSFKTNLLAAPTT